MFDQLQERMIDQITNSGMAELEAGTIVVLPSLSFPSSELRKIVGIEYYEERMLCLLLRLADPRVRIVYVTCAPVDKRIIDYYLSFLPGVDDARHRLRLVCVNNREPTALAAKLLDNAGAIEAIRACIDEGENAFIYPFNVTGLEQEVAERLELPVFGPHPEHAHFGSKTGARRIAKRVGVAVFDGEEDLWSVDEIERAVTALKSRRPDAGSALLKLNNGFSGQGTAIVPLDGSGTSLSGSGTVFCADGETWLSYALKVGHEGAIAEEHARVEGMASPSVQVRLVPGRDPEILSTHDQILGGPDDQVYLGCRFPADPKYRAAIVVDALKVAQALGEEGVIGTFGIDFVVLPGDRIFLSEINLRIGGTTHPYLMARLASGATYDRSTGDLTVDGVAKHYVSGDNVKSEAYKGLTPHQALTALEERGLAFDLTTKTGVTLHLLGALREYGKLGATAIGDSYEQADELFEATAAALDSLAAS